MLQNCTIRKIKESRCKRMLHIYAFTAHATHLHIYCACYTFTAHATHLLRLLLMQHIYCASQYAAAYLNMLQRIGKYRRNFFWEQSFKKNLISKECKLNGFLVFAVTRQVYTAPNEN